MKHPPNPFPSRTTARLAAFLAATLASSGIGGAQSVVIPAGAPPNVKLAAKEVRRYLWLRTGVLLECSGKASDHPDIVLQIDPALATEQYRLKTIGPDLAISGGSDVAVLYGAYAFAEKLGVRFHLHGDVIPDERIPFALPPLDESSQPLFETRGIQPFHDFQEGPDWWDQDDWLACIVTPKAESVRNHWSGSAAPRTATR